jgi:hypothetical protein
MRGSFFVLQEMETRSWLKKIEGVNDEIGSCSSAFRVDIRNFSYADLSGAVL